MERFDVFDKDGKYLDKTIPRGTKLPKGEYHKIVHVWIIDQSNRFLIQQRNKQTDKVPFQWATHGGAVLSGETSLEAAIRETKEEIGIAFEKELFQYIKTYVTNHTYNNYITDVYLIQTTISIKDITIDPTEVKQCSYVTQKQLHNMVKTKQFWNYDELIAPDYMRVLEKRC